MTKQKKQTESGNLIRPMDIVKIVSTKRTKGSTLKVGQELLIAGHKILPEKRGDPYLQRVYVYALIMEDGAPLVPSKEDEEDNGYRVHLLDPRGLEKIGKYNPDDTVS